MDDTRGKRALPPRHSRAMRRFCVLAALLLLLPGGFALAQGSGHGAGDGPQAASAADSPAGAKPGRGAAGADAAGKSPAAGAASTGSAADAAAQGGDGATSGAAAGSEAVLSGVQLRKDGERLNIQFQLSAPTTYRVVGNVPLRVIVVMFTNTRVALPSGLNEVIFNDPYLVGISFERVNGRDTWAKLRLRSRSLGYNLETQGPSRHVVLALQPAKVPQGITLNGVRLGRHEGASRLVFDVSERPLIEAQVNKGSFVLRLRDVSPTLALPVKAEDDRIAVTAVQHIGSDTVVHVRLKEAGMQAHPMVLAAPPRVVVDFRAPVPAVAGAKAPPAGTPEKPLEAKEIPLETLLQEEKNPLISANYQLAEQEYRAGAYRQADQLFQRVFDAAPRSLLGVRAFFRAADAEYASHVATKATNYHDVIVNYQSAIRSADEIGYETQLISRAFFQIGRAYQRMHFYNESNVYFELLQERFPQNIPYTADSYYYHADNDLALQKYTAAIKNCNAFLAHNGDPQLTGPAHYKLGEAYFNLKRYVEAKSEFDRARTLDPGWADDKPLLLFHMGEAYYENAEFDVARVIYRKLLQHYPEKDYTKLVALRLGDFLRDEGHRDEAMKVYRQVIQNAPEDLRLRGELRIADLYAARPTGDDYKQAVKLYDQVTSEASDNPIAQEALLRKALTLTQHGQFQAAINAFQDLADKYPKGPYDRANIIQANIEDNLKALADQSFRAGKYWDVAKLYTRYKDDYFSDFPYPYTLFEVAKAYQHLGLYSEAEGLYKVVLAGHPGSLRSLVEYQRARAFFDQDNLGRTEDLLHKFIQSHKKDPYAVDARMLLGKVYESARRYDDALRVYGNLTQQFERSGDPQLGESISEVYFEQGQVDKELGRNKKALDSYRAAVANFHHPLQGPHVPEFVVLSQFRIGDMLYELGQDRDALRAYQQAIAQYPKHERAPWARYQMGLIYRRLGEDQKALNEFNALVELAKTKPGELWASLARENQRDLNAKLQFQNYLKQ